MPVPDGISAENQGAGLAVLLPDGRAVTAGGNPHGGHSVMWMPADPEEEMRLEAFSPPCLFRGPRPASALCPPAALTAGQLP